MSAREGRAEPSSTVRAGRGAPSPEKGLAPVVVKFGGELLETAANLRVVVSALARVVAEEVPVLVVHGGGKETDQALRDARIEKRQVDGLRMTDAATLDIVVSVLGSVNTRLVAALNTAGVAGIGLTGADGRCGLSEPAPLHRTVDGRLVDLGLVGVPSEAADMRLLTTLMAAAFVPVLACIGIDADGRLLNVNADTFAGHLAARLGARRLVIAGTTAGVLTDGGRTLPLADADTIQRLIEGGTATAGMIAKLRASAHALARGASEVVIVDGRDGEALEGAARGAPTPTATRLVAGSLCK